MLTFANCETCHADAALAGHGYSTETDAELNVTLLLQALLAIHTQPEHWDQRYFFGRTNCGTTRCFAGWALHLSDLDQSVNGSYSETAQDLLGLSGDEAEHLFFHLQTDDLGELTDTVHALLAHRGLTADHAHEQECASAYV